jgi:ribosomal protein S18 acetylase RimI-like enzyme
MPTLDLEVARELLDKSHALLMEKAEGRTIIDTPSFFQVLDPGRPIEVFNAVYRANFKEDRAEEEISAALERFRRLRVPFRWVVAASSRPKDLAARLAARKPTSVVRSCGFAASCDLLQPLPTPHVTVEDLCRENLQDYILAASESFAETGPGAVDSLRALAYEAVERPNPNSLSFLARYKGQAAGIGRLRILRYGDRVAGYIAGGGVRPRFRHRGVARLLSHFGKALKERGIEIILAHAREELAAPIFRKLGFHEFDVHQIFRFQS